MTCLLQRYITLLYVFTYCSHFYPHFTIINDHTYRILIQTASALSRSCVYDILQSPGSTVNLKQTVCFVNRGSKSKKRHDDDGLPCCYIPRRSYRAPGESACRV